MTGTTKPTKRPRRWRRFFARALFVTLGLLTLAVVFYTVERFRGRRAWKAYEEESAQLGRQIEIASYLPPKIPDEQNFASIPLLQNAYRAASAGQPIPNPLSLPPPAKGMAPPWGEDSQAGRIGLERWQKYFVATGLLPAASDDSAADVLKALEKYAAPLAELSEAGTRPHCRFPVPESGFLLGSMSHLPIFVDALKLYSLRLTARLALGDNAGACADFRDGLRLGTATSGEPGVLAGMLRAICVSMMQKALWQGLTQHRWAEPELRQIEADLARLDILRDSLFAVQSERALMNLITETLVEHSWRADIPGGIGVSPLYPSGWYYRSKVRANRFADEVAARIDLGQRRYFGARPLLSSRRNLDNWRDRIIYRFFARTPSSFEKVQTDGIFVATRTDLTRLACAVERYRLAHGACPAELSAVVPEFLPALPAQIVNGEPYAYGLDQQGGFFLYAASIDLDGAPFPPQPDSWEKADSSWRFPENSVGDDP
jgi:hypothetical protein